MQGYGRQFHAEHGHILNQQGIGSCFIELVDELLGIGQLGVFEYGVDGYIDAGSVEVGKTAKLCYVIYAVACGLAGAEPACTYIDGIGPVTDGLYAALQVLGGRKQLYGPTLFHAVTRFAPCLQGLYTLGLFLLFRMPHTTGLYAAGRRSRAGGRASVHRSW